MLVIYPIPPMRSAMSVHLAKFLMGCVWSQCWAYICNTLFWESDACPQLFRRRVWIDSKRKCRRDVVLRYNRFYTSPFNNIETDQNAM